jgi:apolipoprotein N-acyltransferase
MTTDSAEPTGPWGDWLDRRTRELQFARAAAPGFGPWLYRWLWHVRPGLVSALALWLSFPPVAWRWLGWIALVPLSTLVQVRWRDRPIYRPAWLGGLLWGGLSVSWLRYTDATGYYGWIALALALSLFFPLYVFVLRIAVRRYGVPAIVAVPTVWVGLEYFRGWLFTGFPWFYLAHAQYRSVTLIQIADLLGACGVSFLVALINGWVLDLVGLPLLQPSERGTRLAGAQRWRMGLAAACLAATWTYGWQRRGAALRPGPLVALIQTHVPQRVKSDPAQTPRIHAEYQQLRREAVAARPDLVIWPETAWRTVQLAIDPALTDAQIEKLFPDADPAKARRYADDSRRELAALAKEDAIPHLMGVNLESWNEAGARLLNSAVLFRPDGTAPAPYSKIHLVPWGEYMPLRGLFPWLVVFTPHESVDYGLDAGSDWTRFTLGPHRFGVLICFEDTLPWLARRYVADEPVDFLVNMTNDGWFGPSAEHELHLAASVFRAVECRRSLVRAVNTGISAIVDSNGRIVEVAGAKPGQSPLAAGVVTGRVPLDSRRTLFGRFGDWFGQTCQWLSGLAMAGALLGTLGTRLRRPAQPS